MKAAVGALIAAAHAAAFAGLAAHCRGTELAVDLPGPPASPALALDGALPPALAQRIAVEDSAPGPGLHHVMTSVAFSSR